MARSHVGSYNRLFHLEYKARHTSSLIVLSQVIRLPWTNINPAVTPFTSAAFKDRASQVLIGCGEVLCLSSVLYTTSEI